MCFFKIHTIKSLHFTSLFVLYPDLCVLSCVYTASLLNLFRLLPFRPVQRQDTSQQNSALENTVGLNFLLWRNSLATLKISTIKLCQQVCACWNAPGRHWTSTTSQLSAQPEQFLLLGSTVYLYKHLFVEYDSSGPDDLWIAAYADTQIILVCSQLLSKKKHMFYIKVFTLRLQ